MSTDDFSTPANNEVIFSTKINFTYKLIAHIF